MNESLFTPEAAAEALSDLGGYVWHSGGGIMLARVDRDQDERHVLVSDGADLGQPNHWGLGYYADDEDEGTVAYFNNADDLRLAARDFMEQR